MSMILTQSEMKAWRRCRRKWWLTYYRRLRSRTFTPSAASLGNLVHAGLEDHYAPLEDVSRFKLLVDESHAKLDPADGDAIADWDKQRELASIIIEGYLDWLEETGADEDIEVVGTEEKLEVESGELPSGETLLLRGKIDQKVYRPSMDALQFLDHKVVGSLDDIPKRAANDEQFLFYEILNRSVHPDMKTEGGIWNMLRKVKRTARSKPPYYARHEKAFNDEQLVSFFERIWAVAVEIDGARWLLDQGASHQTVAYPNPTRDCSWDCDFRAICPMFDDGSRIGNAIVDLYEEGDPHARYNEGGPS